MDAAQITKKTVLFLVAALLVAGAASAQSLTTSLGSNPTITLSSLGQSQIQFTAQSTDGTTPLGFTIIKSADSSWYSVNSSSGTTPATVTVTLVTACNVGTASCTNANFQIKNNANAADVQTVSVMGSTNPGSGGGSTVIAASQNPVAMSTSVSGGFDFRQISITTNSTSAVGINAVVTSGGGWLQASLLQFSTVQSSPATLQIQANATPGQVVFNAVNTGTIVVTPNNNPAQNLTITVQFTVGSGGTVTGTLIPTPNSLTFAYPSGITSSLISVGTNASTASFSANAASINGWLLVNGSTQAGPINTGTNNVFVSINTIAAAQLSTGQYNGTITFTNTFNSSDVTQMPVTLTVNGGGGTTVFGVAPSSLTFSYQQFKPAPPCQTVVIPSAGRFTVTPGGSPLFLYTSAGSEFVVTTPPGSFLVCAAVAGLNPGSYSGSVQVTAIDSGFSQTIPVTLNIYTAAVIYATVNNVSGTVTCNFQTGGGCNAATLSVSASDQSAIPITVASGTSWITVTGSATETPGNFQVTINPAGLPNGVNTGSITITSSSGATATVTVPVVVTVNGSTSGGGSGSLTLSTSSLTFNSSGASSATLGVTASTSQTFSATATTSSGGNWLSISPAGAGLTTPQNITVSVNPSGLTPGTTYQGTITLVSNGGTQTVAVSYTVPTGTGGNVTADRPNLSFTTQVGVAPATQAVTITSTAGGSTGIPMSISANSSGWLTVSPSSGATPLTVQIGINPSGLSVGAYSGSVIISPTGGSSIQIPVSLQVTAATVVSASPTTLSFSYTAGSSNPAAQSISVTGSTTGLPFTAAVTSGSDWLSVTPTSGQTNATLSVSVNPGALAANQTYNGTIVVSGSGTSTGTTTINVSLLVTAPLPTITSVTNAASFNTGGVAAGEIITIFGSALGPATLTGVSGGTTQYPTTLGGVQVTVGGYLAPLIYVRNDQVAAIVPYEINKPFIANPTILVKYLGQGSNGVTRTQVAAAPGIFTAGNGTGQGAILNQNLSVNSAGNPARAGDTVVLYVTGEGQTNPVGITGKVTTVSGGTPITPQPLSSVTVTIDGQPAQVTFYGEAPGLVAGVMQINVIVPLGSRAGDLPVVVSVGGTPSQTDSRGIGAVTVAVR